MAGQVGGDYRVIGGSHGVRRGRHRSHQRGRAEPVLLAWIGSQRAVATPSIRVSPEQKSLRSDHGEREAQRAGPEGEVVTDHDTGGEERLAVAAAEHGDGGEPVEVVARHAPGCNFRITGGRGQFAENRGRGQGHSGPGG